MKKTCIALAFIAALSPAFAQNAPAKPVSKKQVEEPQLAAPKRFQAPKTLGIDASHKEVVAQLNAAWNAIRFASGDFVQIAPDGRRSEGRIFFTKPGLLRFEYDPPSPIEVVADGKGVAVRDRKLNTQDVYPIGQTPLQFMLAERIDLAKDSNVTSVSRETDVILVMLEEKKALGGTHRLMLIFDAKDYTLKQWSVTDAQGFETNVGLHNLNSKDKPQAALYKIDYTNYAVPSAN
jgi:outer membrane lipoprotein-sorting protein